MSGRHVERNLPKVPWQSEANDRSIQSAFDPILRITNRLSEIQFVSQVVLIDQEKTSIEVKLYYWKFNE